MTSPAIDTAALRVAADEIVLMSHRCYARGWSPATSSNYSMRLNADVVAITCSGLDKGDLTSDGIMVIDNTGSALTLGKPSAETLLHTQIYNCFSDCGAVLHTHSAQATVISRYLADVSVLELQGYEIAKAFSGIQSHEETLHIPVFDNTQDIPDLAARVDAYCQENQDVKAYIIRGHGLYVWGETMQDCWRHLEALEYMLSCQLTEITLQK